MLRTILIAAILCGAVFGLDAEEHSDMKSQTHAPMHPHHGHGHHGHHGPHGFGKVLHKIAKVFGVHRRSHHGGGQHDAMIEQMRANLKTNCGDQLVPAFCDGTQCPRKQLKCLAEVAEADSARLSPVCAEFVATTTATMREHEGGHHTGGNHNKGHHNDESSDEEAAPSPWGRVEDGDEWTTDSATELENGCFVKKDGLWCPREDGSWIRDDGVIYEPEMNMCMLRMIGWALAALMLLIGLVWGFFERKRRNSLIGERQPKIGSYFSSLCECFSRPFVCIPACLFTPVLAAFNRAEADDRECNTCDVCFALLKPVAQYTTRQTIRGKYNMRDENCSDCCSAVCCTPCAVAQDTLELEKRAALQTAPTPMTAPGMPVYVIAAQVPPSADMSMSKIDKADEQV